MVHEVIAQILIRGVHKRQSYGAVLQDVPGNIRRSCPSARRLDRLWSLKFLARSRAMAMIWSSCILTNSLFRGSAGPFSARSVTILNTMSSVTPICSAHSATEPTVWRRSEIPLQPRTVRAWHREMPFGSLPVRLRPCPSQPAKLSGPSLEPKAKQQSSPYFSSLFRLFERSQPNIQLNQIRINLFDRPVRSRHIPARTTTPSRIHSRTQLLPPFTVTFEWRCSNSTRVDSGPSAINSRATSLERPCPD